VDLVVLTLRSSPSIDLQGIQMLGNLYDELTAMGTSLRIAEAAGPCRDAIKKGGLEAKFGKLSPGMSVQKVIDEWFKGQKE
jgi:hypothetical protein